ncbi:MAG: adaptor protein MecA [Eubacterium sp.]|nr:adaptor protein MecA [Eubacterium sp.]
MFFWKIDEETIRCLINKEEIGSMGYKIEELEEDDAVMSSFLDDIVNHSTSFIQWNTENGVQAYTARMLPSDQFLLTISCTFQDELIDKDLDIIRNISTHLKNNLSEERFHDIYTARGEHKEQAFGELIRDLHRIFSGDFERPEEKNRRNRDHVLRSRIIEFDDLQKLIDYSHLIRSHKDITSRLYRKDDRYMLMMQFFDSLRNDELHPLLAAAFEFDGILKESDYEEYVLSEHADLLIDTDAIGILDSM